MGKIYQNGDSAYIACAPLEYFSLATNVWTEVDADDGFPVITIIAPDGTTNVDAVAMTKRATGKYDYEYELPASSEGQWRGYMDWEYGSYPHREHFTFEVEA